MDGNGQRYPWCYNWAVSQDDCAATASASASAVGYEMVGSGATKGCSILYPFGQNVKQDIPCEQYNTGSFGPSGFKGTGYPVGATPAKGYSCFAKTGYSKTTSTKALRVAIDSCSLVQHMVPTIMIIVFFFFA